MSAKSSVLNPGSEKDEKEPESLIRRCQVVQLAQLCMEYLNSMCASSQQLIQADQS